MNMQPWKVLNDEEILQIHQASIRILSQVGISLDHPRMCRLLLAAGAHSHHQRLLLPEKLVEQVLAHCDSSISLLGRDGLARTFGTGELHWHNLGGARDVYEPIKGKLRPAIIEDVINSTRLLDALDQVTTVTPFFTPTDVPGGLMSMAMYRYTLPHTVKPIHGPGLQSAYEVEFIVEMATVIGDPKKTLTLSVSPVSPLNFPSHLVEAMIVIAQHGIPFTPLPCPTAGTTAPMSLAGALALQNAEILASLAIVQHIQPGLPLFYSGRLAMMEPRSGSSVWGGVELGLASAATVQLGHFYKLPVNVYGFSTNAHIPNLQSGYERALNALLPALAGADELSGIGELAAGASGSYAQMVCDNEIAASVRRALRTFRVDEEALAVEIIHEVMHGPRNFLGQPHTRKFLRAGEVLLTELAERSSFEDWHRRGAPDIAIQAHHRAEHLIKQHHPPPLLEAQEKELERIWQKACESLRGGN